MNELALQNVRSNAEIQASDLSHILANKIQGVTSNLQVISVTDGVQNQELDKARTVLDEGQNSTSDLTSFYMLLDKDGKMLLISNANETTMQKYSGTDLSYRDYFVKPKETLQHYYGNVIESNDNVQRVYFSDPVISKGQQQQQQLAQGVRTTITTAAAAGNNNNNNNQTGDDAGTFNGVVVAAVDVRQMGSFLQSQIPAKYAGSVGLMDSHGAILYSQNTNLIGKKAFGPEFQSLLLSAGREFQQSFNKFLEDSLKGQTGSSHFAVNGTSITIAYQPVAVQRQTFGVLYISLQQNIKGNNDNNSISGGSSGSNSSSANSIFEPASLIAQQRNMSLLLIAAVGAVAVAAAYLVLSWNKKLESTVRKKTSELDNANRSLAESNAQLVEANEMLKAHDKMQTEFVNIAAHELRTPIQPIIGVIELLKSKKGKNDNGGGGAGDGNSKSSSSTSSSAVEITSKQLGIMDRNAKRLQKLSAEILDATRIEAGTLKLDREVMDINQKVRNVIADSASWIPQGQNNSNIRIQFNSLTRDPQSGEPLPLLVNIDRLRMFEVVSNLLRNAIKFSSSAAVASSSNETTSTTTARGIITITTEKKDNQVVVSVKDYGTGISTEMFPRLFTKFATDRERGGTGLGLFIAKNIVEAHGGRIWAENNQDGKGGATFTFTLPLAPSTTKA